jgi:hypothetical protein
MLKVPNNSSKTLRFEGKHWVSGKHWDLRGKIGIREETLGFEGKHWDSRGTKLSISRGNRHEVFCYIATNGKSTFIQQLYFVTKTL